LIGGRNNPAVDQILLFERRLAQITTRRGMQMFTNGYVRGTIKDLQKWVPSIEWESLIRRIVRLGDKPIDDLINLEILMRKDYLRAVQQLITETPDQTLHNYLLWRIGTVYNNKQFYLQIKNCDMTPIIFHCFFIFLILYNKKWCLITNCIISNMTPKRFYKIFVYFVKSYQKHLT
jgi:hypothetical protein